MEVYLNTWWQYSPKALRRNGPAEGESARRFAVVGVDRNGYLVAWKVEDLGDGWVWHPAYCGGRGYPQKVRLADIDPFVTACPDPNKGSAPTALFKPDSLYVMCV